MKSLHLLIICMMLAWVINLEPSLKYPFSTISTLSIIVSMMVLGQLVYLAWHGLYVKLLRTYLIIGTFILISVALLKHFQVAMMANEVGYYVAGLQIPFYVLYGTPFFGLNYLFEMQYSSFSLMLAKLFVIILCVSVIRNEQKENRPIIDK